MKGPVHGVATAVARIPEKKELPQFSPFTLPAKPTAEVPNSNTVWKIKSGTKLTPNNPIVLNYENNQGIVFERKITLDEKYLFSVEQNIKNNTDKNNILLSCYDGKGVSPLVVALYIMKNSSITKDTVRQLIQSKCKDIALDYELSVFDI